MRVTFTDGGDGRHDAHDDRQHEQTERQLGRHDDRQRGVGRHLHQEPADSGGDGEPDDGVDQGLPDDDLVNIAAGRTDGAQRGEFVEVILGAGIERLRDDDGADDDAEQRPREQGRAGAGAEQPERRLRRRNSSVVSTSTSERLARSRLHRFRPPRPAQRAPGNRWPCWPMSDIGASPVEGREDERRGGE